MTRVKRPNRELSLVMAEAGVRNTGLANRMREFSRHDGGEVVKTTHTHIAKYLSGEVGQPGERAGYVMLRVLGDLVGRNLRPAEIGYPDLVLKAKQDGDIAEAFEDPLAISERLQWLGQIDVDDSVINVLNLGVNGILERYEVEGPRRLAPEVIRLRARVDELLRMRQHPTQLTRLYELASKLSGMMSYMAVNRGRFTHAKMYATESFKLASLIEAPQLKAWILGTESFCAYYMGQYEAAVRYADAGLECAAGGPQAIRILSNGMARALGKLGDVDGVREAITQAEELAETFDAPAGLSPALTFEPYSSGRLAANAATAYLAAGDFARTLDYGHQVEALVDESDSVWSRSLVRLDVATAMVRTRKPDLEQALHLGREALVFSEDRPIRSVWQRAHEFAATAATFDATEARDYTAALQEWSEQAKNFAAPAITQQH